MEIRQQFYLRKNRYEIFLFLLWSILTLSAAGAHEPWRDEIQAFLIARELSIPEIFHRIQYEGHFLPWYLLLKPFTSLGPEILPFVSWGATAIALAIFLFFSPFSRSLKTAVCLSSPFLFWYPVVSRCYALIPPLLFLICLAFPKRREHPVIYGGLIALLANTHLIAEGMVLFLFLHSVYEIWQGKRRDLKSWIAPAMMCSGVAFAFITVVRSLFTSSAAPTKVYSLFTETLFFLNCLVLRERYIPYELFHAHAFPVMLLCGCLLVYLKRNLITGLAVLVLFALSTVTGGIISTELFIILLIAAAVWGKKNTLFLAGTAISSGWLFITVWLLCPMLSQRALSVLFFMLFSAWIAYEDFVRKKMSEAALFIHRISRDMLPLFLVTLVSGAFLLYSDINGTFSDTPDCGRFLASLPREYETCTLSMNDGLVMLTAWSKRPMNVLPIRRKCIFYPREKMEVKGQDIRYFAEYLRSPGKKVVVAYAGQNDIAEFLKKLSYYRIYVSKPPFAVKSETFHVYAHSSNLKELKEYAEKVVLP